MANGTIKKIVGDRGFGFIRPDGYESDLFCHATAVQGATFEDLREGQAVEFDVEHDPRRDSDRAVNVRVNYRSVGSMA